MNHAATLSSKQTYFFLLSLIYIFICSRDGALASSASESSETTGSRARQTHTVSVGKADHKFDPDVVQADVWDIVEFQFFPTNHSVVRAEYEFPCIPYEMTGEGKAGFFSGFHVVDKILSNPPTFLLEINDTLPVFFYCSAPGSCIDQQMVGVINPNGSVSLDVQKQKAADSSYMLNPGESFPDETPSSATMISSPVATSSAALASETAVGIDDGDRQGSSGTKSTDSSISNGAIAGIAVGISGLIACSALALFYCKKGTQIRGCEQDIVTTPVTPSTPQTVVSTPRSLTCSPQGFLWSKEEGNRISELPS